MNAVDWSPALRLALLGLMLALGPLAWVWLRHRTASPARRLHVLTLLTLFLTFDLVLFGAFTRLTDSGLGCPDWPGCYGSASPLGAKAEIAAAQSALPTGPVTRGKAWVEMTHRYLATAVGVLILVMTLVAWRLARGRGAARDASRHTLHDASRERPRAGAQGGADAATSLISPWWPTAALLWVIAQGAFGALTVTMKLQPAIVTLHLLGGIGLLVLLAVQDERFAPRPLRLAAGVRALAWAAAALLAVQIALGGWVSTNYAVLACADFPTCQGQWWPPMDFAEGFALTRELGQAAAGGYLPFPALTAIHVAHRVFALGVFAALGALAWALWPAQEPAARRFAAWIGGLSLLQAATGLSNVVLGWPLVAAVLHTGGAAALAVTMAALLARARAHADEGATSTTTAMTPRAL
jgi:heme a synthase